MSICRRASFFLASVSVLVIGAGSVAAAEMSPKALFEKTCSACHSLNMPMKKTGLSVQDWGMVIDRMKGAGLEITDANRGIISKYLSSTYPKK